MFHLQYTEPVTQILISGCLSSPGMCSDGNQKSIDGIVIFSDLSSGKPMPSSSCASSSGVMPPAIRHLLSTDNVLPIHIIFIEDIAHDFSRMSSMVTIPAVWLYYR